MFSLSRSFFLVTLLSIAGSLEAKPEATINGTEYYEKRVRPLLIKHCYECHSEEKGNQKGGLLLDRESGWLEGGDMGKAVVPGQISASLLVEAVEYEYDDTAMPPKYKISDDEIKILKRWVTMGAPGPAEKMGETEFSQLGNQEVIFEKAKDHWAFQPVTAPKRPKIEGVSHPVDQFVFSKLSGAGLTPSPRATPRVLTRRLSYDLTGLPPTDESMYERTLDELVDALLATPAYGERVARMWLDVARYADTASTYRADTKTPHYYPYAFTYRDYVVGAFNADLPYDQFITEQLAADLMKGKQDLAALGFIGVSPIRNMSSDFIDDAIDVTTRGFLGLTVSCARCHDHKFEPIPTADYYSLSGVFNSLERPAPWQLDAFPEVDGYEVTKELRADYVKARKKIDQEIKEAGDKTNRGNTRSLAEALEQTKLAELLLFHKGAPAKAMVVSERKRPIEPVIYIRGEPSQRGEKVPRRFLRILDPEQPAFSKENSGRLDLARKITDPKNPLTARVFVNRIWGMLMGDPIVDSTSDFGMEGGVPSHPELLDFLAADFMKNGWSTKHLVRQIVTSRTYQQSSRDRPEMAAEDPENKLFWRANLRRLEIEELRDSLLAVSGRLDPAVGGRAGQLWGDDYSRRRSLYGYIDRFNLDPTLRNFDFPSPMQSQGERTDNIVAPQALFLMNSPFVIEQADTIVEKLDFSDQMSRADRVEAVYRQILQRSVTRAEINRISKFADIEKSRKVNPWPLLAQSLLMSNEFLYVE